MGTVPMAPAVEWAEGGRERERPRWLVVSGRRFALTVRRAWVEGATSAGGPQARVFLVEAAALGWFRIVAGAGDEVSVEWVSPPSGRRDRGAGHLW